MALWLVRLPETLPETRRIPFRRRDLADAARVVLGSRFAVGLILSQVAAFGFFTSYLASSEAIVAEVLGLGEWFPVIFGATAAVLGAGVLVNTRLLQRLGLRRVLVVALRTYLASTLLLLAIALASGGTPPLWAYALGLGPVMLAYSMLLPDLNSAAMLPMGRVAGMASAIIGGSTLLGGALIGSLIDRTFDGTITPFAIAAVLSATAAVVAHRWADAVWPRTEDA
jgi:DHA1 family bicyclomycin/chloramphenicol resistance-like MFS transporter